MSSNFYLQLFAENENVEKKVKTTEKMLSFVLDLK